MDAASVPPAPAPASMPYVPLWCKSNYSFLEGAAHPEELVARAHALGLPAVAITDRDGVYGVVRAWVKARELKIKLIIGAQMTLEDGSYLVLLARDREGYRNLCRLITVGRLRHEKGECRVTVDEVCAHAEGMFALWGGEGSALVREAPNDDPWDERAASALQAAFGDRLFAMISRHRRAEEPYQERRLLERARRFGIPLVAATEVLYPTPDRRPLQDVLTCIRHGVTVATAGRLLKPNAEHDLKAPEAFAALYADLPEAIARGLEIAEACTFDLGALRYVYPSEELPDGSTSSQWLRTLTLNGAAERYPDGVPEALSAQIDAELALIDELDYCGYFLTMWEIVRFCREQAILCQGRGSAANSVVCYCLGITRVRPGEIDLLFERFLSRERAEPPDIDLDIEHERREEVIQYVYRRYGRKHAAMVANVIRYRTKSAMREVGRALGLPETVLSRLSKLLSHHYGIDREALRQAGLDPDGPVHQHLLTLSEALIEFPRHLSIHPGGFLLGHEPVHDLVPIENATMEDRTVIQWDKYDVEELGLFKVDLLGLGALSQLRRCLQLIKEQDGVEMKLADLPPDDPATYDMIGRGDTVGVFQIESRAQMSMLPRLRPRNYYDLVIEVSIVRPGPISGGMVHPYLRRRSGQETYEPPHECMREVLKKTLGVPLFQEQVMRLAVVAADYTPGEADQLRRDMAAWRRSGKILEHRERLISGMAAKGIAPEFAEQVFKQIQGFGEYGFPESHAASFAKIAYATAWMRCHRPREFACSLLNAQPMGFYRPHTIIDDARRNGVRFLPVSVAHSDWDCTIERPGTPDRAADAGDDLFPSQPGRAIPAAPSGTGKGGARTGEEADPHVRIGLRYVNGLSEVDGAKVMAARSTGPFRSVDDFARRTGLDERRLKALAAAGAFDALGGGRRAALWDARGASGLAQLSLPLQFPAPAPKFPALSEMELVSWDYSATGHSTRDHLMGTLRAQLVKRGLPRAKEVLELRDRQRVSYVGLVIGRQRPGTAAGVTFMTLEDETGFVNLVVWKDVFERFSILARTAVVLGVTGRVQSSEGVVHVVAETFWEPELELEGQAPPSRDFH